MTSRMRTVSPSTHPRPASGGATDFLPASALLDHQQALRPPGEEDARCVQPTSATQSNCVHPHLVCSRLLMPLSQRGRPTASAGRHSNAVSSCSLPHGWSHERGRLLPTALDATEPLTPLSRSTVHPHASLTFARAATWPYVLLEKSWYGSEDAADHRDHRRRRLVKSDAS